METYLYVIVLFFGFVFVMAIIQGYAYLILQQEKDVPQNNTITLTTKKETRNAKPEPKIVKHDANRWTYSERNLHKAILKGRRNGHLQIMYHGQYWPTGLKIVTPCQ